MSWMISRRLATSAVRRWRTSMSATKRVVDVALVLELARVVLAEEEVVGLLEARLRAEAMESNLP